MFASIPVVSPLFKGLLDAIGWVLAWIYHVVPNYGLAIILLTVLLRVLVLPLGIKQIKSMGAMQALAPRIAEIKKKYKGNNQKIQEETMRLYREVGVNPAAGCLPMLLSMPFLIAMYSVLRAPTLEPTTYKSQPAYAVGNSHLPVDSTLFISVLTHQGTKLFPGFDLECSARTSGNPQVLTSDTKRALVVAGRPLLRDGQPVTRAGGEAVLTQAGFDCGNNGVTRIPYFVLLALMIATTFYQQLQMQRVSPPGAASQQQQIMLRMFPLLFGFWGFQFSAGLVLYWTVSNSMMIGQQWFLLKAGHIGPEALERQIAQHRAKQESASGKPQKTGWLAKMMERAQEEQKRKGQTPPRRPNPKDGTRGGGTRSGGSGGTRGKGGTGGRSGRGGSGGSGNSGRSGTRGGTTPRRPPPGRPRPKKPDPGGEDGS